MPDGVNKGCSTLLQDNKYKHVKSCVQPISFQDVFTYSHLKECAHKCGNGVRWKASVQMFEVDGALWAADLLKQLYSNSYKSKGFHEFYIKERGKERFIQSVHVSERCVQKCLTEYCLKPLIMPRLIYDNSASLAGKGTDFALKRLRQHLASHYRNHGLKGGILLCDYENYFGSIQHKILLPMVRNLIQDNRLYELTKYFVDQFGDVGLGLGSEISQILAVYYCNEIDHFIKERLHIK